MSTGPDSRPRRSFPREGFTLLLDADGLEIRVDDYHARPLKLSWAVIEQLRAEAQARRPAAESS